MATANPIPAGYHTVTPYITAPDARALMAFLKDAFGAELGECHTRPDGKVMHAEVRIGDSPIMISDACEQSGGKGKPAGIYLYVPEVDKTYKRALEAGATSMMEPADMFWGDRFSSVKDEWDNEWHISTHIEDVTPEELDRRAAAFAEQMAKQGAQG